MRPLTTTAGDGRLLGAVATRAVDPGDVAAAARLRADVYVREKGWLPATVLVDGCEQDADDARAVPLVVRSAAGDVIATFRALVRGDTPLPVERLADVRLDPTRAAVEASRLVVARDWRGGGSGVLLALCRLIIDVAEELGADDLWAILEQPLLGKLRWLGFPFQTVGDPVRAYHTDNVAAVLRLDELAAGLTAHQDRHGCAIADYFTAPCDGTVPTGLRCGEA